MASVFNIIYGQTGNAGSLLKEAAKYEYFGDSCITAGNANFALDAFCKSARIRKEIQGIENVEYISDIYKISSCYAAMKNYDAAIKYGKEALEIVKHYFGNNNSVYPSLLYTIADYYSDLGNYDEAVRLGTEALNIRKEILGIEHPDYIASLDALALDYSELGNYAEAVRLGTEAVDLCEKIIGREHPAYAAALNNLAIHNYNLGNYAEAIRLGTKAIEIHKKNFGERDSNYAMSLGNLANYNSDLGNYTEAVRLGTEAMEIIRKNQGIDNSDYARALNNLAYYYSDLGNYTEAVRIATEAMEILKNHQNYKPHYYAASLNNLAFFNSHLGNYVEAVTLETKAMDIREKTLGINHPEYAKSLSNLACYNRNLENYSEALKYALLSLKIKSDNIIRSFSALSSQRRSLYWDRIKNNFNKELYELCLKVSDPLLISSLYDKSALLAKGILLNTEIEMKKLIEESRDMSLVEKYQRIQINYEIFNKQNNLPISERNIDTDSLNQVIQKQEDDLISKSKVYGDYMRNLRLSWKDVQKALEKKDIAIEFLDFPIGEDSIMYIALTLKRGYKNPQMTPLFELRQLKKIQKNKYYRSPELAKLIWGPLDVYFSPSGELHRLGIEYLPTSEKEYIFDKYQMHRLSSTRQIVLDRKPLSRKKAVLYGGIDYNASKDTISSVKRSSKGIQIPFVGCIQVDSLSVRGSREYLEGTKIEADNISTDLKKHRWRCDYYTGVNGTEESFKIMSGKSPSLLHVATHGFYMTETDVNKEREIAFHESKRSTDKHHVIREDKPMTRSGLLLAGCNHTLNHETIPEDSEDGILTAQEIASLDLRGLDLVVLSACETGLGDISSGEGVFGLQRGFKKAGANTIIMSLWKVSDNATESLMTYFYHYFLNGMTKYNAFSAAREKLRKECPPRQNKPDWAAFIMLDGIK